MIPFWLKFILWAFKIDDSVLLSRVALIYVRYIYKLHSSICSWVLFSIFDSIISVRSKKHVQCMFWFSKIFCWAKREKWLCYNLDGPPWHNWIISWISFVVDSFSLPMEKTASQTAIDSSLPMEQIKWEPIDLSPYMR